MPNRGFCVDSLIEQKHYYSVIENSHEIHIFTSTLYNNNTHIDTYTYIEK